MKTTKLFFMAALALMTAACSNDDNDLTTQQPQKAKGITITAQLAPKTGGADTRAVSDGDNKIVAEWAENEHLAVLYEVSSTKYVADATITAVDGSGTATITFTVEAGTPDNTTCTLVYPAKLTDGTTTVYKDDLSGVKDAATLLAAQDGTLNANLDVRVGAGTIQTTTPGLTVTTQPAAQFAIFKFTLQDLSTAAKSATEFKVSDGSGNVMTTVTPGSASGELYVALPVMAAGTYWFNATIDSKPYIAKATTAAATVAGKYYQTTVKMATIGDVILSNGKFAKAGTAGAVAMIAYLGSDNGEAAPYNHGLALAMSDANGGNVCEWKTSRTDAGHIRQHKGTFTEESGLQYNAMHNSEIDNYPAFKAAIANNGTAAPTGCSAWFLASGYQWIKMFAGDPGGLQTLAGLESHSYWSSSESGDENAWFFLILYGDDGGWGFEYKYSGGYGGSLVRSCLAF